VGIGVREAIGNASIIPNANTTTEEKITVGLKLLSAIADVPDILQFIELSGQKTTLDIHFQGGLYTGISQISLSTDWSNEDKIIGFIKNIRVYMEQRKGNVIVEFATKSIRSAVSVWGENNEGVEIMRGIKHKFDPTNGLNHGRFVGGI
jgi:glycolate oxidase FAD binding subunit